MKICQSWSYQYPRLIVRYLAFLYLIFSINRLELFQSFYESQKTYKHFLYLGGGVAFHNILSRALSWALSSFVGGTRIHFYWFYTVWKCMDMKPIAVFLQCIRLNIQYLFLGRFWKVLDVSYPKCSHFKCFSKRENCGIFCPIIFYLPPNILYSRHCHTDIYCSDSLLQLIVCIMLFMSCHVSPWQFFGVIMNTTEAIKKFISCLNLFFITCV